MLPSTIASFGRVGRRAEAPQTADALLTTFLSPFQGAEARKALRGYARFRTSLSIATRGSAGGLNRPGLIPGAPWAARICNFSSGSARR